MGTEDPARMYDAYYFTHGCGRPYARDPEWFRFFGSIADHIVNEIQPSTVLDAGCAWGFLVEILRQRGMEAYGIDVSPYAIQNVHPDIKPFCWVGSVSEPFPQRYDLIVCIEVLEHMTKVEVEKAVENFCLYSDDVLFSSTPFDYKEATHLNVQPPEYWTEIFARHGFFRDVDFDASFITPWAVRFRRRNEPLPRMVREYERKFFLLWKENVDLRSLTMEMRDFLAEKERLMEDLSDQIKELDRRATMLSGQLREISESRSWKLMQKLQRVRLMLIPQGSWRDRMLQKLLGRK